MSQIKTPAKTMTKSRLANELAEAIGSNKKTANQLLDSLCNIAYRETNQAGEFTIPGIGKLVKKQRKAREGRNPATGEAIAISSSTVVRFRVAGAIKQAVGRAPECQKPRDPDEDKKDEDRLKPK